MVDGLINHGLTDRFEGLNRNDGSSEPCVSNLPSLPALSLTTLLHTHGPWGRLRVIPLGCTKLVPFGFLRDPLIIALAAIITIKKTGPVIGFILDS
jgi:hypothetical protein